MSAIPVIFSTGSLYPFGLDRVFGWAAEVGFDGVEVMMDDRWDTHQPDYLNELVQRHGVPILALHPPIYTGAWRLGREETLVRSARLARRISCPLVVAHPPPPGLPLARWMDGALTEARAEGVTVAVENMPANQPGVLQVRRQSCHLPEHLKGIGAVTLDTSHVGASGVDLLDAHAALVGQLRHVHLSDSNLVVGKDEHRLPGKGQLPLRPFLGALAADGYQGAVSLELKPWPLGAPDPGEILVRTRAAFGFVRGALGGG
ncbi:TIM barrel protein [Rubrobacter tropicus]|uniref:TIM barrel protein n=1 Tax=Rubrobacter tropicus TaxID=2653851 RepID=A0A6G8Q8F4_9ACTN|nr:sugar phosphate isomerase/epimerase family protein [Rubrobacter tropicus]QIN82708.1 TIM barrel protein [Rubrobacter tropicus]